MVYQWTAKRFARDNRNINLMESQTLAVAEGKSPLKKVRFLKVTGAEKELDEKVIERARMLAGLKGYETNLPSESVPATQVISACHDLRQVEASFRMTKSDLRARPIFHHEKDSIDAHVTVVFAALAIGRHLQELTGLALKRLLTDLKAVKSAIVVANGQVVTFAAQIPEGLEEVLTRLRGDYLGIWHDTGPTAALVRTHRLIKAVNRISRLRISTSSEVASHIINRDGCSTSLTRPNLLLFSDFAPRRSRKMCNFTQFMT